MHSRLSRTCLKRSLSILTVLLDLPWCYKKSQLFPLSNTMHAVLLRGVTLYSSDVLEIQLPTDTHHHKSYYSDQILCSSIHKTLMILHRLIIRSHHYIQLGVKRPSLPLPIPSFLLNMYKRCCHRKLPQGQNLRGSVSSSPLNIGASGQNMITGMTAEPMQIKSELLD